MDNAIVYALQSLTGRSSLLDAAGVFLASVLIWFEVAAVALYFILDRRRIITALGAFFSAVLGLATSWGIGELWFRPRPFAELYGVKELIAKSALDKSFPSDHATIAFAIAISILLVNRRWGTWLIVAAAAVCFGRVYVGVHYPTDVLAGAVVGTVCALVVHRLIHYFLHTRHRAKHL